MQTPITKILETMNNPKAKDFKTYDWVHLIKILSYLGDEKMAIADAYKRGKQDALDNIEKTGFEYYNEKYN
jgi:hypothetical protein